jgi:hypothetical protein
MKFQSERVRMVEIGLARRMSKRPIGKLAGVVLDNS